MMIYIYIYIYFYERLFLETIICFFTVNLGTSKKCGNIKMFSDPMWPFFLHGRPYQVLKRVFKSCSQKLFPKFGYVPQAMLKFNAMSVIFAPNCFLFLFLLTTPRKSCYFRFPSISMATHATQTLCHTRNLIFE